MERRRTMYHKTLFGNIDVGNVYDNLERCREISNELMMTDIIDPNSRQIGLLSELLFRMKHMPELEILDLDLVSEQEPN